MPRLVGLLLLAVSLVLVAVQNPQPIVPLVVLGQPMLALPLGWWLAGAIGSGAVTMGCIELLAQVGRRSTWPTPVIDRRAKPSTEPPSSPRQRVLDNSLHEAADEWSDADGPDNQRDASGKKSWRSRLFSLEAEPRPSAVAADLEQELADWSAPDRSQKGWNHDPEWDEWEDPSANPARAAAPRRSPPVNRPERPERPERPANRVDRPFDRSADPLGDRVERPERSNPPARADRANPPAPPAAKPITKPIAKPIAKPIEAPTRPAENQQQGTVYSIRYQRAAETRDPEPAETPRAAARPADRPEPDLPPPETRSRAITDAEYRVLIPPAPETAPPPAKPRSDWD